MQNFKVFKVTLKPLSYFSSNLSSYTIFGAFCWTIKYLYGEKSLSEFMNLLNKGNLFVSSAMPMVNKKLYAFKPILKSERVNKEDFGFGSNGDSEFRNLIKKYKKLRFVPLETFLKVSEGEIKTDRDLMIILGKEYREISPFISLALPHAKLNRITNSTTEGGEFYFEEAIYFNANIYFLIAVKDEMVIKDILTPAMKLMQDWGIGGNRSIGFGDFSFKIEREKIFEKFINRDGKKIITLAPVVATNKIDYEKSFYDIRPYKGAIESGYQKFLWKPKIFYLESGSLIHLKEGNKLAGALIKPFKQMELYHYGLEFPIYIKES